MNYAFQVKKLTTLITFYTTNSSFHVKQLLENPTSEFKQSAYKLFHEIFKHSVPVDSQQTSPVNAIFDSVTASLDLINQSEVALIEATQKWWNEWYFVLTMEHSLSHEKEDVP